MCKHLPVHNNSRGRIRIIGGKWKRRKLAVPVLPGLRPTPDASRETVFNWLSGLVEGAACLDLFAGTGALGLEAASRGAARVDLVDSHPVACRTLLRNSMLPGGEFIVHVHQCDAIRYLESVDSGYDIVFLDPPFAKAVLEPVFSRLSDGRILNQRAMIYVETDRTVLPLPIPADWHIIRQSSRGIVNSLLIST